MMKKAALWVLPLGVALALSGCSGPQETPKPTESATQQGTGTGATPAPAETTPAAIPPAAHSANQLGADELLAVVKALKAGSASTGAKVVTDAELKAGAAQVEEFASQLNAKPEVCGAIAANGISKALQDVNMASLVLPADANAAATSVSVASYATPELVKEMVAKQKTSLVDCKKFTLTIQGREAKAETRELPADSTASITMASVSDIEVEGQKIETLSVTGVKANTTVGVTITAPAHLDKALKQATGIIDNALELVAQK